MNSTTVNKYYKLYNLTCDGRQFLSVKPPTVLPDTYYSLVEICYTKLGINSIKGIYVGQDKGEMSECILTELDINHILVGPGNNYPAVVQNYISQLPSDDISNIINGKDIIDFDQEDEMEILVKIFLIGLGSVLVYYYFMTDDQSRIGYPFHPLRIDFPTDQIGLIALDQNVFAYLNYPAKILINISTKKHGKLWMIQLMDFCHVWGVLFPRTLELGKDMADIIYESILGYSNYIYTQTASMGQYFTKAENVVDDGCQHIDAVTKEA